MSAATSVKQVPSTEAFSSCNVLVLYEDLESHDRALEVCRRLVAQFNSEVPLAFGYWDCGKITDAIEARQLSESVADADIVLVSMRDHRLAALVAQFLMSSAARRRKSEGALALQLADSPVGDETLLAEFRAAARGLRMDFLPLALVDVAGVQEAGRFGPAAVADEAAGAASHDHWGLNE